jgi:hypothetical protein
MVVDADWVVVFVPVVVEDRVVGWEMVDFDFDEAAVDEQDPVHGRHWEYPSFPWIRLCEGVR